MASDDKPPASPFDIIFKSYPHIAEQIVRNIPLHLRWDVAAVNSDFYNMICKMDSKKHRIAIEGDCVRYKEVPDKDRKEILENDLMASIINSGREIDELELSYLNLNPKILQQLIKIAEKFGKDIKRLHWFDCKIDFEKDIHLLIQFLEELTNLQELDVHDRHHLNIEENQIHLIPFKPVLKKVEKFYCTDGDSHIMSKFIAKDTLTEYNQEFGTLFDYDEFIRGQSNLKSITVMEQLEESYRKIVADVGLYKHLKHLQTFQFGEGFDEYSDNVDKELFVQQLIRDHPNLRELCFAHNQMMWNSTTLATICEHGKEMENLSLSMEEGNCWSFLKLSRLKQLKDIEIDIYDTESFFGGERETTVRSALVQFSKLNMPTVHKLDLKIYGGVMKSAPREILTNFAISWSNLKELHFAFNFMRPTSNPNVIDAILQTLGRLESLKLDYTKKIDDGVIYPNLKKLILGQTDEASLLNMIKAFPNLIILKLPIEFSDCNYPLLIQRISTLNKLKIFELWITLKWTEEMSSNDDFYDAIRRLCRGVLWFWIYFEDKETFDKIFAYWSRDNDFCKVRIVEHMHRVELIPLRY